MEINLGIRILDIISEVTISPNLKTTHYEPLYHYIASSNVCIYAKHLCEGETKFPIEKSDHFNPSLDHESIANFIPIKHLVL